MRVLVDAHKSNDADITCRNAQLAKRTLREKVVTTLLIGFTVGGRESGLDILKWATQKSCLPVQVILLDRLTEKQVAMAEFLRSRGYRSADNRRFILM